MNELGFLSGLMGEFGFPVVVCIILFQMVKEQNSMNREQVKFNNDMMVTFKESIDKNTIAIERLSNEVM